MVHIKTKLQDLSSLKLQDMAKSQQVLDCNKNKDISITDFSDNMTVSGLYLSAYTKIIFRISQPKHML